MAEMAGETKLISVFSEDQVERITGVTKSQLRYWDKTEFFAPKESEIYRGQSFGRIYSFRELTSLKVLNELRNIGKVPLQTLRELKSKWDEESEEVWLAHRYRAMNKRVHVDTSQGLEDAVIGQKIIRVDMRAEYEKVEGRVASLYQRDKDSVGKIWRQHRVVNRKPVIAGTRIKVDSIKAFARAGYSIDQILLEYPDLELEDIKAAIDFGETA